jgi:VanZ family protein
MHEPAPSLPPPGARTPRAGFFLHVMPAILYVGAIFYGGSVAPADVPDVPALPMDKLLHFIAFAVMQITVLRAVRFELPGLKFSQQLLVALVLSSTVGGALELYQLLFPERSAELLDFVADVAGALAAAGVLWVLYGQRYDEPA